MVDNQAFVLEAAIARTVVFPDPEVAWTTKGKLLEPSKYAFIFWKKVTYERKKESLFGNKKVSVVRLFDMHQG